MNRILFVGLFYPPTLLFGAIAFLSLQWRMVHDAPIMLYSAYLIDHFHRVPYRDFFDVNMVGGYFINVLVGRVFGYGDLGLRCADLLWLASLLIVAGLLVKGFGCQSAWSAALTLGLCYLHFGPTQSMQREYLLLPFLAGAVLAATTACPAKYRLHAFIIGLLIGIAATVKPQSAIALPLVLGYVLWEARSHGENNTRLFQLALVSLAGAALAAAAVVGYLWWSGGLVPFLDIVLNYLPLYAQMGGEYEIIAGPSRLAYLAGGAIRMGGHGLWLIPAVAGTYRAFSHSQLSRSLKRQAGLFLSLAACYAMYPAISGQFNLYSYLPFLYFAGLSSSLCFVQGPPPAGRVRRIGASLAQIVLLAVLVNDAYPPPEFFTQIARRPLAPPKQGRVDEIAGYLETHMVQGERVQPLDWTGGAVHAMLIARAPIATPFIHDMHLYRTIQEPYIQNLRRRLIDDLQASAPLFIIQIETEKEWLRGPGTTRTFAELQQLLDDRYVAAVQGKGYVIWERISPVPSMGR